MKRQNRMLTVLFGLFLSLTLSQKVFAKDWKTYDSVAFAAAQEAGKTILLDVKASWCPTCKRQGKILNALLTYPEFKDIEAFEIDFDDQKEALKDFNAESQSTLIVFKGKKETQRSVGVTDQDALKKLLESGL